MANALLDTNIYGKIIEDSDSITLIERILRDDKFVIHNFKIIRDELRRAPNILRVYDKLVKTKMNPDTREIGNLASEYFKEYKAKGGVKKINKIKNDFKIVAYASLKNCDLVFSDDEKTLKHNIALQAYRIVNLKRRIRTPTFYTYKDLKRSYF